MKNFKNSIAALACLSLSACGNLGTGEKVGQVVKLAQTGVFCKTWEGEIVRGGYNGGSGVQGAAFNFTIEDPALVKQIQDALDGQYEIRLYYRTEMVTFCRSDSDDHFVTKVEVLNRAPKQNATVGGNISATTTDVIKILVEQNEKLIALLKAK
jgi:hypothetical protein